MTFSSASRLIMTPWAQIGKAELAAVLPSLNGLHGPTMLGDQWPANADVEAMHSFLANQDAFACVIAATGDIVGGFGLSRDEHASCWFYYYVFPEHQGKGMGTALLGLIEETGFSEAQCHTIKALCALGNESSIRALRNAGFFPVKAHTAPSDIQLFVKTRPELKTA